VCIGHVKRADRDKWISKCRTVEIEGTRRRGRGEKKWVEVVEKDMKALGLKMTGVQDRGEWRRNRAVPRQFGALGSNL